MKKSLITGALIMSMYNTAQADQQAITQVIQHYADATASRDVKTINQTFHDDFRVIAITAEGPRVLDKSTYLKLLEDRKIGGMKRKLKVKNIEIQDQTAHANISLTGDTVIFHDQLQLIQAPQGWQIVNNLTEVTPVEN